MFNRKKDELRNIQEKQKDLLVLIKRAENRFVPFKEIIFPWDHSSVDSLTEYLDRLDREDKELCQNEELRNKVEKIVLDLRNRKWEPGE